MIIYQIKRVFHKMKWRKSNSHNDTSAENIFNIENVKVGRYTYGPIYVLNENMNSKLTVGDFCSIAPRVSFCLGSEHRTDTISTFPFKVKVMGADREALSKGDIVVDNDVWLGYGATIMSGVHIGQGAVVAAGAVVTKDVPPYAIVGGVPAKVIKYRFPKDIINKLMCIDYSKVYKDIISNHIDDLYQELRALEQLDWVPKK